MSLFVLVHSPSVGPSTWEQVADELREAGHDVVVPSLLRVGENGRRTGAGSHRQFATACPAGMKPTNPSSS
jgi:hypothetical protein